MGRLYRSEDLAKIEVAVAQAERATSGELVVAVVARSDGYERARGLVALALASLGVALAHAASVPLSVELALGAQIVGALLVYRALGSPALLRLVAGREAMERAVEARALELFSERGVHATRERNGVLVLVSEAEHRVVILGDTAIDARFGKERWQAQVDGLVAAIRAGEPLRGLLDVVQTLGTVLGQEFPRSADDANELPDTVTRAP